MPAKSFALALTSALLVSSTLAAPLLQKRQGSCETSCQNAILGITNCAPTGATQSSVEQCICGDYTLLGEANTCYTSCQDYISSLTGGDQINQGLGAITQGCAAINQQGGLTSSGGGVLTSAASQTSSGAAPSASASGDASQVPVWLPAGDSVYASLYTAASLGGVSTTMSAEVVTELTNAAGATVTASFEEYIAAGPNGDRILDVQDADNFVIEDCLKIDEVTGDCVLVQIQGGSTAFATHFTATGAETLVPFVTAGAPSAVVSASSDPLASAASVTPAASASSTPSLPFRQRA